MSGHSLQWQSSLSPWLLTHSLPSQLLCALKGQALIVNTLWLFPCIVIMHIQRARSVIKGNYSMWGGSMSNDGSFLFCATHYWISIVDAAFGVVYAKNNGGGQQQREMIPQSKDPFQERDHHRRLCQVLVFVRSKLALDHGNITKFQIYRDASFHICLRQDWGYWWSNTWERNSSSFLGW